MQWLKSLFSGPEEEEVWEVNVNKLNIPVGNANNKDPQNLSWANYEHRKQGGAKKNGTRRNNRNRRNEVWEVNVNSLEVPVGNANNKAKGKNLSWADYNRRKRNIRVLVPNENYVYSRRKSRKAKSKVSRRK